MEEEIYVSCHAPSLSLLLFETARSVHDQKGLLIGQVCNEVISRKTDENEMNHEHKTAIYLEHCIPIEDQDILGKTGSINKTKFKKLTDILQNKIIGWYSFRRNSKLVPSSLSEHLIHKSLLELIPNIKCQYFVACFLSSNAAANMSTHTFNHVFMNYDPKKAKFESLRLKIYTLSDKSVNSNGYLMKSHFPTSRCFDKIVNYNQKEESPVKSVLKIQERISDLLQQIDQKLQKEDSVRLCLENEVETLRKKFGAKKKGNILIQEPEKRELKIKTIRYNPNTKYNSSFQKHALNPVEIISSLSRNFEKKKTELKPSRNYSSEENLPALQIPNDNKNNERKYLKKDHYINNGGNDNGDGDGDGDGVGDNDDDREDDDEDNDGDDDDDDDEDENDDDDDDDDDENDNGNNNKDGNDNNDDDNGFDLNEDDNYDYGSYEGVRNGNNNDDNNIIYANDTIKTRSFCNVQPEKAMEY